MAEFEFTTDPDTGTDEPTANALVRRDASGRAAFVSPSVADDAATKGYVDTEVSDGDAATLSSAQSSAQGYVDNIIRVENHVEADLPQVYDIGITITETSTTGWAQQLSTVITYKHSGFRAYQHMVKKETGAMWVRSATDETSWTSWIEMASKTYVDALLAPKFDAVNVQTFTSSGTYTPTSGMKYARVRMVGGGGSGGQAPATGSGQRSAGQGGGAGCYGEALLTAAQVGASKTVTVGAAGVQGNGGTSSVGSLCSVGGGTAGGSRGPSSGNWAGYTNVGSGSATSTGCYLTIRGGWGMGSLGVSGVWAVGGDGGDSVLGQGSPGNAVQAVAAATGYGAGGGAGANTQNETLSNGGDGSPGIVIIEEYLG